MKKKLLKKRVSNLEKTIDALVSSNAELNEENELLLDQIITLLHKVRELEEQLGIVDKPRTIRSV